MIRGIDLKRTVQEIINYIENDFCPNSLNLEIMITSNNKERLTQEILSLIRLMSDGRDFFFIKTGLDRSSSSNFMDHWKIKDLFQNNIELTQLELNIQLFYIKLSAYYESSSEKNKKLAKPRNAFAHKLTSNIFNKKIKYNFFFT